MNYVIKGEKMSKKSKFYAYYLLQDGYKKITASWEECKVSVEGKKARYKSFSTEEEAKEWLENGAKYEPNIEKQKEQKIKKEKNEILREKLVEAVYFDAGTGRGIGVEVRVTNLKGESYLPIYFLKKVNEFDNINLGKEVTNNYGELVGLYCAIEIAIKEKINKIFGDSNLVLYYWSQGRFSRDSLPSKTINLIEKVIEKRKEYEKIGGKIDFVSGDINPADLGFHK